MKRTFDFYEYAGIIVPGAVLLLGLLCLFTDVRAAIGAEGFTFGDFGVFIIVAYASGQMVQAVGNWIDWVWWKLWRGIPSKRLLEGRLLSAAQHKRLVGLLRSSGMISADASKYSRADALSIAREVYSSVAAAGNARLVDTFNGTYSLMRGLAAAFAVLAITATVAAPSIYLFVGLAAVFLIALQRMHRFGNYYAQELFIQFLSSSKDRPEG